MTSPPPSPAATGDTAAFDALHRRRPRGRYLLTLYITGSTPRSTAALGNIRAVCDEYLHDRYDLEVVDLYQHPAIARGEQIVAAPTLVKRSPKPVRRLIGDLSQRERVLGALGLRPASAMPAAGHAPRQKA